MRVYFTNATGGKLNVIDRNKITVYGVVFSADCLFKEGCDMLRDPIIIVNPGSASIAECRTFYYQWDTKQPYRIYKVTKIRPQANNLYEVSGHIDVLNTYKDYILAPSYMMERQTDTGSNTWNSFVTDDLLQPSNKKYKISNKFNIFSDGYVTDRGKTYVLQMATRGATSDSNATATIAISDATFHSLAMKLMDNPYAVWQNSTVPTGYTNLDKGVVKLSDFIYNVRVYPISYTQLGIISGEAEKTYYVGWTNYEIKGRNLTTSLNPDESTGLHYAHMTTVNYGEITLPQITEAANYPACYFTNKFINIKFNFDNFGTMEIDPSEIYLIYNGPGDQKYVGGTLGNKMYFKVLIDFNSGEGALCLTTRNSFAKLNSSNYGEYQIKAAVGVEIPLSAFSTSNQQSNAQLAFGAKEYNAGMTSGKGSNIGAFGSWEAGATNLISGVINTIKNTLTGNNVTVSNISSGSGSMPMGGGGVTLTYALPAFQFNTSGSAQNAPYGGYAVGKAVDMMNKIQEGYNKVICDDASIPTECPADREEITHYLLSGLYYEPWVRK